MLCWKVASLMCKGAVKEGRKFIRFRVVVSEMDIEFGDTPVTACSQSCSDSLGSDLRRMHLASNAQNEREK